MKSFFRNVSYLAIMLSVASGVSAQSAKIENKELKRIFYSQALLASWSTRVERAAKSIDLEKNPQFRRLVELAFRYWCYSKEGVIDRDVRFENLLFNDFIANKVIPLSFLDDPIPGKINPSIPGYRWPQVEYDKIKVEFKEFILGLKTQDPKQFNQLESE